MQLTRISTWQLSYITTTSGITQWACAQRRVMTALAMVVVGGLSGCSGSVDQGPPRANVSGLVKYQGQPVPFGTILFVPVEGSALPVSSAKIVEGRYSADANGGVPVGKHRVEVTGWKQSPDNIQPTDVQDGGATQLLPAKYNTQSTLELTVDSKKAVQKDFDLN